MTDNLAPVHLLPVQGARVPLADDVDLRALIPYGASVRMPIRYSQDVWNFEGFPLVNQVTDFVDFAAVPIRWRSTVKDWTLLRLNPSLARSGHSGLNTKAAMAPAAAAAKPLKLMSIVAYVLTFSTTLTLLEQGDADRLDPEG